MLKCRTCPYKQGIIQCVMNPCIACYSRGWKTHPFGQRAVEIHENQRCMYCGSNRFHGQKCADCGRKTR